MVGGPNSVRRSRQAALRTDGQEHFAHRRQRRGPDLQGREPDHRRALNIEAVAEALLFASRSGADPERVRKALMGGFASSRILEVHGERMTKRTFNPGFRIELHQKDLNLALDGARKMGLALPHTASAQQLFSVWRRERRQGMGPFRPRARTGNHVELQGCRRAGGSGEGSSEPWGVPRMGTRTTCRSGLRAASGVRERHPAGAGEALVGQTVFVGCPRRISCLKSIECTRKGSGRLARPFCFTTPADTSQNYLVERAH